MASRRKFIATGAGAAAGRHPHHPTRRPTAGQNRAESNLDAEPHQVNSAPMCQPGTKWQWRQLGGDSMTQDALHGVDAMRSRIASFMRGLLALAALLAGVPAFAQSAVASTTPSTLNQANLRQATVSVTLTAAVTYAAGANVSHFTLTTAVPGLTVHSVTFNSGRTVATLRLHYDGSDFNAAATIAVTVAAAGTSHSVALTTGTVAVGLARWVNVSKEAVALTEGGSAGTYTVVLESPPTGNVSVVVTSDNAAVTVDTDVTPTTRTLTFTTTNWATAQTVTVTPVDDNADAVDELALVTNIATGGGYVSSTAANRTVRITVADDERTGTDYDADDDQLIEIDSLAKLNAVRWDLDGDGTASSGNATAYAAAFPGAATGMGCPDGGDANQTPDSCAGYELTTDLDFDTNGDGNVDSSDTYPNWTPIGGSWTGDFNGNNRTISNLTTSGSGRRGLFANLGTGGGVSNLGLIDFNVSSTDASGGNFAGALAGWSGATVEAVSVRGGTVSATFIGTSGYGTAGGLVGQSATGADIKACYSTAAVSSNSSSGYVVAGGLVGLNYAPIVASYASGTASATGSTGTNSQVGGLAGGTNINGPIRNSYATGAVSSSQTSPRIGGLVGFGSNVATASYWDSETTGQSSSRGGSAQTTNGLQTPTGYGTGATDLYAYWDDYDTDGDGRIDTDDDAWDFGTSSQYPSLKWGGLDPTLQFAVPDPEVVEPPPPPNQPPVAVGAVDDVDLALGGTARVSLPGLFIDEAPEGLTYAVSSSNPKAVAARLAWPAVELEGLAHGAATVTVTATDPLGLSATLSFVVRAGITVSFAADASAPEGGMIRLTLTASRPAPEALAVHYVLTGDDGPADHDGGTGGTAAFAAGATEAEITVPVLDDAVVEPVRERFLATLAEPAEDAGYGLGLKTWATATVEEGVCDRDPAVRDELRRERPCAAVADLSRWTSLRLRDAGIQRLRSEDLLGLSGLLLLDVTGNRLPAFPAAALAALPNLWSLHLADNRIDALPAGLEHPALLLLDLSRNGLTELPAGSLSGFTGLRRLHLSGNALAALPGGALAGLGSLRALRLDGNRLPALPAGLFAGLGALQELHLQGNPGAPFMLAMELTRTDAEPWAPGPAEVAARAATGAPFTLRATLAAADGTAAGAVSVPAGAIQGPPAEVADSGVPLTLTAAPAPVPDDECRQGLLDVPCYSGFATVAGEPLTLFKTPPRTAPLPEQALDGDTLRLPLAAHFGVVPGGEALSYAVESSDPSVASVRVEDGVLLVEADGDGVATVTVTATDAYGQTGTLTFTVRATLPMRGGLRGWRLILIEEPPNA